MRSIQRFLVLAILALPLHLLACSCFGPSTFCETLHPQPPQFPDPQWWVPDHIVLGVKLNSVEYGADLKVVQDFSGGLEADEVVRVWGDCGFLCRMYVSGVAFGDTVLWAIQDCDLSGNGGCGSSLEQADHFQLSVCGVYWLGYSNGVISGPLFTEGANETISVEDFSALVNGCLSMGVGVPVASEASISCMGDRLYIALSGGWQDTKEVCITDLAGRVLHEARFRGPQGTLLLPRRMHGLMVVRASDGHRTESRRVICD